MREVIREAVQVDEHERVWPSHEDVVDAFGAVCRNSFHSGTFADIAMAFSPQRCLTKRGWDSFPCSS